MTNLYNLITPPSPHLKPESDLTCGNTSSNPASHQTKSTALPGVVHVDFLHRLVGSDPGHFSCKKLTFTFSLNLNLKSVSRWHLIAEKAICLCKPGTMPLYKAVRPSFLATETKVPSWEVVIVCKDNNVMDTNDSKTINTQDDNIVMKWTKNEPLREVVLQRHCYCSALPGLGVSPGQHWIGDRHRWYFGWQQWWWQRWYFGWRWWQR